MHPDYRRWPFARCRWQFNQRTWRRGSVSWLPLQLEIHARGMHDGRSDGKLVHDEEDDSQRERWAPPPQPASCSPSTDWHVSLYRQLKVLVAADTHVGGVEGRGNGWEAGRRDKACRSMRLFAARSRRRARDSRVEMLPELIQNAPPIAVRVRLTI